MGLCQISHILADTTYLNISAYGGYGPGSINCPVDGAIQQSLQLAWRQKYTSYIQQVVHSFTFGQAKTTV